MSTLNTPEDGKNIEWCGECGRFYNTTTEHECNTKRIESSRKDLEKWLGKFQVEENG